MLESARASSTEWFTGFVSMGLIILACGLFALKAATGDTFNQVAVYLVFFSFVPVIAGAAAYLMTCPVKSDRAAAADKWLARVGPYVPLIVLAYGMWGIDRTLYHHSYESIIDATGFTSSSLRFFLGCSGAVLLVGCLVYQRMGSRSREHNVGDVDIPGKGKYVFLGALILSLFRIDLGHDSLSYDPFVGPASAVLLGSIPMVDVFSQYGLNYLVLAAGLKVLPWSMYSTSLIVTLLDLVYYFVVALVCVRMSRDKILATALSALLVLFLVSSALYNSAYTPSVLAMRFLPSMLVVLSLCRLTGPRMFSWSSVAALCLSSLWSFEAMAFSAVAYSTYLLAIALGLRPFGFVRFLLNLGSLVGLVLLPHLLLTAGYLVFLGVAPRYDIYMQLISTQTSSSMWIVPADSAIRTWVILGFSYALAFSYGLFRCWTHASREQLHRSAVLAAIAALGILQLSYYAGRAVTPVLVFLAFPLLIVFVLFVDELVRVFAEKRGKVDRPHWIYAGLAAIVLVACGGVIGDRFFREPYVLRSNATLLRDCLTWHEGREHCWTGLRRKIADKLRQPAGFILPNDKGVTDQNQASWQLIPTGMTLENIAAYQLGKKWLAGQDRIYLFIPDSATVLFALKKRNALGLTHPMVDDRSSLLRDRAMEAAKGATEGTIIMVGDLSRQPIEVEILDYLKQRWTLERIDGGHSVVVYRLKAKA